MAVALVSGVLILAVLAAAHWYHYLRLVRDTTRAGSGWRRAGTVLAVLAPTLTAVLLTIGPAEPSIALRRLADATASFWLPVLLWLTLVLLLGEAARPLLRRALARRAARPAEASRPVPDAPGAPRSVPDAPGAPQPPPGAAGAPHGAPSAVDPDASRRLFVARTVALGAAVLAAGGAVASRTGGGPSQGRDVRGLEIAMPFTGRWLTQNSPARQVPSHGTDSLGGRYAIDFVAVDDRSRTAADRSWRTFLGTERPEIFHAFGRPITAPVTGTVVAVHDGETDHAARRSQLALLPYMMGEGGRLRRGVNGVAGNHVIIAVSEHGPFVALAHFRTGSVRVTTGQKVAEGEHIADCGNSGNSTQPHIHLQAMDSDDLSVARGVPMVFRRFREWPSGTGAGRVRERAMPGEEVVVEPLRS
ncbi:M23 family metallopeptidase [Streptomyces diacarni]|uniref:M23 family metallopeptidase n=1 Tax=Streptomyces diacarni TaxID=2800381 RepID=UPI0033C7FE92